MPVHKAEYLAWRGNPVSQEFLDDVLSEADTYIASLVMRAGIDPHTDRYNVGRIDGLKWLAEWQPEFIQEETDEDA